MEVGEEVAVDAPEPGGVLGLGEALHVHHVHLVTVAGVGEANLVLEVLDESQRLQVRVELLHGGHGDLGQVLHHVAHRDVVGEPHLVRDGGELPPSGGGPHPLGQVSGEAETRAACCEPETDLVLKQTEKMLISVQP